MRHRYSISFNRTYLELKLFDNAHNTAAVALLIAPIWN